MNKIYRVVWNETTQTWNAVAEFAKAHGKTASSGIGGIVASAGVRFAFTAIMSGLLLASGQVMAAENSGKTLANGKAISAATEGTDYNTCYFDTVSYNVVCGDDTTKALDFIPQTGGQPPKQGKSVSIGQGAQTSGESNVAIGPKTVTANTGSIAIGAAASANHNQSIAMGQEASAKGEADVSIGKSAGDTVSSGGRNISIGESALKGGSGVNNVIAIGSAAGIDSNSSHSVYIGTGATGMDPKNVAIGNLSKTKGGSIAVGDSSNAQGSSSVAIGTSAATTGVAANGVAIGFNSTTSGLSAVAIGGSSSSGKGANASGPASLAIMGTAVASAQRAIAVGELALGSGSYGIAIGGKANAQGTSSIAIGGSQATDKATNATGNYSTAIGYGAKTVNHDTTAVGKSSSANGLRATAFGVDSNADAENALAVGPQTAASAKGAIAVGFATQATGMSSVAVGKEAIATKETSTSLGQNSQATANNAIAIGNKAVAAGTGNIVVGTNAGVYDAAVSAGRTVGADTVYIGADSGRNAYTNERQISIGKGTGNNATGVDNIALGLRSGAFVVGANNVAIGKEAGMGTDAQKLNVTSTVAIGEAAKGSFNNTVAIGKTALAEKESAVAVGTLSKASGDNSVAIGKAANASGSKALALGVDSVAVNENDVALGSGSLTDAHHSGNYTLNSNYTAAGTSSQGTVSVGKVDAATPANNFTRQIQNVSAGVISATSTDAINGSQLYATNSYLLNLGNNVKNALGGETAIDNAGNLTLNNLGGTGKANVHDALEAMNTKINQLGGGSSSHFYSVQTPSNARGNYNNDGATGLDALAAGADAQAAGEFAVAVGTGAQAVISNSIAIGKNATVNEDTTSNMDVNGLTKGEGSVAIGAYTKASGTNATAVGQSSNAYGQNSLAAGQSSKALGKSSVALGDGANATQDSASSLGSYSQATAAGATALGFNTRATAFATVAAGRNSKAVANNAVAVGNEADAQKEDTIAIGYNAQATQNRAVAFGKNAQATAGDTFAFGDSAKASVGNAIAFGKNANAAHAGSIALGANSATEAAVQTTSATVGGLTFGNFAGNAPESTLSIGTAGKERTITNVAAGRISNNSTDAINGSQLYATQNVMNNIGTTAVGVLGGNATIANDGTIKMTNIGGTGASTIEGAISAINNASYKSFKLNTAKTSGTNGEANNHSLKEITNGSTITLEAGKNIVLNQNESTVSINTADAPEFAGKITAKGGLDMSNTKITNLGKGDQPTDAVNLSQLTDAINNVRATTLTTVTNDAPFAYVSDDGRILKRNVTVDGSGVKKVSFVYADDANTSYNGAVTIAALNPTDPQTTVPTQVGNIAAGKGQNDAVNVSQLDKVAKALGTSVNSATGEIAAPKYSVISGSPATSGVADYNDVGTALTALSNAVRAPLTFAGDSGTPSTRQLGSTVTVKGGEADATKLSDSNNIGVVSDDANGTLNVKLAKELQGLNSAHFETDGNVTTINGGNVSLADKDGNIAETTANGITLTPVPSSGKEAVSLTKDGLNNGGNKITKVAKGTDGTDAVNVAQLNEQLAATEKTTTVAAGKNVTVSEKVDGNNTEYTVNADKTTLSQAANGAVKVSEGAKDADGVTDYALDLTDEAKADIAKGVAAKDAVDNKGLTFAADNGTTGAKKLGDSLSVKGDGNILTRADENGIGFSLADTVKIGQDSGKPVSIDGVNGTVSGLSNKALGGAGFATKGQAATEEQLNAAQANLANLLGGNAANNNGNVTFTDIGGTGKANVHDAIAAVKETAEKGWNLKANDETSSEKIAAGDTVTFKEGKNIKVSRDGKNITVATSDDVSFNKVTVGDKVALSKDGLKAGDVNITADGIDAGNKAISNVAKGVKATDAVNVAQLNEQLAATEKTTTVVAGKNVTVSEKVDGNNTEYTVNADKTTLSQAANGAVKVSEGAKDADGVTDYALDLTDEAKADIAKGVAAKDAVDNKGLTFAADNGTTGAKKLGDSLNIKGDGNILTRADENGIGFSLADKITVGKAGKGNKPLVIDGTAGLISGLSNTTLGGADFATKGQAASEEQLNATQANLANLLGGNAANDKGNVTTTDIGGTGKDNVHDAIAAVKETADKGWNLNANDETSSEKIGAGDTVTFKEGKNVKVSRNGKNITVATSDDVSFDKVTVGGSVLTDNGLTVGNGKAGKPVSLTKDGLNNGGNKVSDIAAGEADTDAVNVAQLKAAAAKATSKVDSGNDNIVVTPEQNADGSTTYKVATAPNLKADSFTAGDTVVNKDGVKVGDKVALGKDGLKAGDVNITADGINAGNKAISNVAAGVKDTDAANVGQLNRLTAAAKTEVEAGTNIAGVTSKQGANGQTVYTVNADGASVSAGSDNIVVTKGNKDADNVTDYAVDLSKAVKADIAKGVAAKDAVDNKGISFAGDSGTTVANKLGDTVAVKGDANITTTAGANGIQVGLNKDLKVDSVKAGDTVVNNNGVNVGDKVALGKDGLKAGDVNITAEGINAGGKKVTGVAAGTVAADSTDAVNGSQLYQANQAINQSVTNIGNYVVNMGDQINQRIDNVESDSKAGTAAAMAVAGLPQAYLPGKSMMAVAGGVYRGESGYAVGFSSISDGGNWVIKGTATGNSRGHYGATAGVGYQW
ncbi:ESPR-type extended signal peptide-containing protein [Neisseria sicca]|uniref:ESPR-type extended signal peptide-containing protein n=1 Tax=Neisseria sicca TaxID=490 RepID=UPI0012B8011E|nr:ESPR-type extended signal peptide-containing protein [Neisseria sicca]